MAGNTGVLCHRPTQKKERKKKQDCMYQKISFKLLVIVLWSSFTASMME